MTCQEFWNTMPQDAGAHPHPRECAACAARLRREAELAAGMRALAAANARLAASPAVEARLLAAFRIRNGTPVSAARRRWIPTLTWAAALAATLAFGFFLMRQNAPVAGPNPPVRQAEVAAETAPNPLDTALDQGYLPLPGAEPLAPADDVSVVHVELPRSAMMQVGIAVNPANAADTVLADVMIGSDGLARAVRFVDAPGSD